MRLRRGLRRAGIATVEQDIWQSPEAAATVRGVAGGNETVPTVFVGAQALVNPSVGAVREAIARAATGAARGSAPPPPDAPRGIRRMWRSLGR
ncbi:MAG: glutaredoxin domain-containing protein [Acidimicrobiales bacterium]